MRPTRSLYDIIMDELDWHALIDASQLDVAVDGDVVTVVGSVPSVAAKLVVLDAIESIEGVHDIVSEIDVDPAEGRRADEEIARVLGQFFEWDALVPAAAITHEVLDGWVLLRGEVPTARQRAEAERVVNHVLGVRGVTNELVVAETSLAPAEIRARIEDALERRAVRAADHIDVVVDEHTVTLRGEVQSHLEKRAIVGAIGHTTGVDVLCDDLTVRDRIEPS